MPDSDSTDRLAVVWHLASLTRPAHQSPRLKCTKFDFRDGGAYSAPPDPL